MTNPMNGKAPGRSSAPGADQERTVDISIIVQLTDSIKSRLLAGEVVSPLDVPEYSRPLFWSAIQRLRDDMPRLKAGWRTVSERHIDGQRVRQRVFRLQAGYAVTSTLRFLALMAIGGAIEAVGRWFA